MKIVINRCFGGFSLSKDAIRDLGINGDFTPDFTYIHGEVFRTYTPLIKLIEEKGTCYVSGNTAVLKVVEIPDNVVWHIETDNGLEVITETPRVWC